MEGMELEIHSKGEKRGKDREGTSPTEETAQPRTLGVGEPWACWVQLFALPASWRAGRARKVGWGGSWGKEQSEDILKVLELMLACSQVATVGSTARSTILTTALGSSF